MIEQEFIKRLPLRNLQWQSKNTTKIIANLDLDIKRFQPDIFPKFTPGAVVTNVFFVHLFFVGCEDVDQYRSSVRKQLQDWLNAVCSKKNQEWMIVHVQQEQRQRGLFTLKRDQTVFEKLKSDFMQQRRVFQLRPFSGDTKDMDLWGEMFGRMAECVVSTLTQQVTQYEEDSRRIEQQRMMPGWNYCQYFVYKEAIVFSLELAGLYDEALAHYDELEAAFIQTLKEQGAPWFKKFGGTEDQDDSRDIMNFMGKPYRDWIIQNTISIFDFRIYLFARQAHMLMKMNQLLELTYRAKTFINQFSTTLVEYRLSLFPFFKESWVYCSNLNVIQHCDEILAFSKFPDHVIATYEGMKGEMLLQARLQLDTLGSYNGFHKYHLNGFIGVYPEDISESKISQKPLSEALKSQSVFDDLYLKTTQKALKSFQTSARPSTIKFLISDLGNFWMQHQKYDKAIEQLEQVCFKYAENGWHQIDVLNVKQLATCYRSLSQNDKLMQSLCFLVGYDKSFSQELLELSQKIQSESLKNVIFDLKSLQFGRLLTEEDPLLIKLVIDSELEIPVTVSVSVRLSAGSGRDAECQLSSVVLEPGKNTISVAGDVPSIGGRYVPTQMHVRLNNLLLLTDLDPFREQTLEIIPSENALKLNCFVSPKTGPAHNRKMKFTVSVGREGLQDMRFKILPLTSLVFDFGSKVDIVKQDVQSTVKVSDDLIHLGSIEPATKLSFELNFRTEAVNTEHKVSLLTSDSAQFLYSSVVRVQMSQLLEVSHEPIYGPEATWIKYTIINRDKIPLRVYQVDSSCQLLTNPKNLYLFPGQSLPILTLPKQDCQLLVHYNTSREELSQFIKSQIQNVLQRHALSHFTQFIFNQFDLSVDHVRTCAEGSVSVKIPSIDWSVFEDREQEQTVLKDCMLELESLFQSIEPVPCKPKTLEYAHEFQPPVVSTLILGTLVHKMDHQGRQIHCRTIGVVFD
ncbi:hypothetical protein EDD86DRAFT_264201 [Gorgonomyces haynaldii]|nr:hypothetical protein EDD86DRAFT_264201 [Gorgonomyces haynaldii]